MDPVTRKQNTVTSDLMTAEEILEHFPHYRTCSLDNLQEECVTHAATLSMLRYLKPAPDTLVAIVPRDPRIRFEGVCGRPIAIYEADDPAYMFARIHNTLNARRSPALMRIAENADVHPTAVLGPDGLKHVKSRQMPGWPVIRLKHMGGVAIETGAQVGPKTVVHRAVFDETRIGSGAVVGSLCNIGHNADIGDCSVLTAGVMVGGSAVIGPFCWVGMGAVILNQVQVCAGVRIGAGSVVTRNIARPGVYVGSPARFVREWDGRWDG